MTDGLIDRVPRAVWFVINLEDRDYTLDEILSLGIENGLFAKYYDENNSRNRKSAKQNIRWLANTKFGATYTEQPTEFNTMVHVFSGTELREKARQVYPEAAATLEVKKPEVKPPQAPPPSKRNMSYLLPTLVAAALLYLAVQFTLEKDPIARLADRGDIDGLRAYSIETTEMEPLVPEDLAAEISADLKHRFGISGIRTTMTTLPKRHNQETVARAISRLDSDVYHLDLDNLVAVFPHFTEPVWLFREGNKPRVVRIGVNVNWNGNIGYIEAVSKDELKLQIEADEINIVRPKYNFMTYVYENTADKSIIYDSGGNLKILFAYLGLEEPMRDGTIAGYFPPWRDKSELIKLCRETDAADIPLYVGLHEIDVTLSVSLESLLDNLLDLTPFDYKLMLTQDKKVLYRGQTFHQLLEFAEVDLIQAESDTLTIWR